MTDAQYEAKFQEMQKYIPFLQKVIAKLKVNHSTQGDNPRKAQLQKMEMLHDLLTNKAKKLKMETLMKCEGVLIKLHAKIEKNDDTIMNNIRLKSNEKPSTSTNQAKDIEVEDLTGPASPPPEIVADSIDQPVVIPTERRCSPVMMKEKLTDSHNKQQQHQSGHDQDHRQHHHSHHHHHDKKTEVPKAHSSNRSKADEHFQNLRERIFSAQDTKGRDDKHSKPQEKHSHQHHTHHHRNDSPKDNRAAKEHSHHQQTTRDLNSPTLHRDGQHLSKDSHTSRQSPNTTTKTSSKTTPAQKLQTVKVVITEPLPAHIKQQHFASYRLFPQQNAPKPRESICHSNLKTLPQATPQNVAIEKGTEVNEAYSPEELWDEYNESRSNKYKNTSKSSTSNIFSRLGDKVPENSAPISIPGRYTPIPDILKSPPLSVNDINTLLIESGADKMSKDVSEVGCRRPPKAETNNQDTKFGSPTNSLDFARKKLTQIAKMNSPQSEAAAPVSSPTAKTIEKDNMPNERVALKYNPHPRQERLQSLSSNDGSEHSTQSRIVDPRIKAKLHSTNPLQNPPPPQTSPSNVNVLPSINLNDPRLKRQTAANQHPAMTFPNSNPMPQYGTRKDPRISRVPPTVVINNNPFTRRLSTTQPPPPHYSSEENWDSDESIRTKPRIEQEPIRARTDPRLANNSDRSNSLERNNQKYTDKKYFSSVDGNNMQRSNTPIAATQAECISETTGKKSKKKPQQQIQPLPVDLPKAGLPKSDSEENWDSEPEAATTSKAVTKHRDEPKSESPKPQPKPSTPVRNTFNEKEKEKLLQKYLHKSKTPPISAKTKKSSDTEEDWDADEVVEVSNKKSTVITKDLPTRPPLPEDRSPIAQIPVVKSTVPQLILPAHNQISPRSFGMPAPAPQPHPTPPLSAHQHITAPPLQYTNPFGNSPPILPPTQMPLMYTNPYAKSPYPLVPPAAATHVPLNFYTPSNAAIQQQSSAAAAAAAANQRFSAVLNDKSERIKYFEARKQKCNEPRTYKEFREARERQQAQEAVIRRAAQDAEAKKKAEEFKLQQEKETKDDNKEEPIKKPLEPAFNTNATTQKLPTKSPTVGPIKIHPLKNNIKTTPTPPPIPPAESTLDKMYRTQNFNSKFPKASTSFKIPKKKSEEKTTAEETKNSTNEEILFKPDEKTGKKSEKMTNSKQDLEANKKSNEQTKSANKEINKIESGKAEGVSNKKEEEKTNQATPQVIKKEEKVQEKKVTESLKSTKVAEQENKSSTTTPTNEGIKNIRDPRCRPRTEIKPEPEAAELAKDNNKASICDIVITSSNSELTLKPQPTFEEKNKANLERFNKITQQELSSSPNEDKNKAALDKFNKAIQELSPKPQRIMRRRNTMVLFGSAPLVDKDKLMKANALLFEDVQEQEKRKRREEEEERQCARRKKHLEEMFQKTDDNCTVSTQNIITGKRRTRTTINFNETVVAMNVFKHISKKDATTVTNTATPPQQQSVQKTTRSSARQKTTKQTEVTTKQTENSDDEEKEEEAEQRETDDDDDEENIPLKVIKAEQVKKCNAKANKEVIEEPKVTATTPSQKKLKETAIIKKTNDEEHTDSDGVSIDNELPSVTKVKTKNVKKKPTAAANKNPVIKQEIIKPNPANLTIKIKPTPASTSSTATSTKDIDFKPIPDEEHQNCAVSSTSAETPLNDTAQPSAPSLTTTTKTCKKEADDNEPSSTANKSNTSTPTPEASVNVLNDIVQQILKPNSDRQHILGLLGQILSEDKLELIKNIIETKQNEEEQETQSTKDKDNSVKQTKSKKEPKEDEEDEEEPIEEEEVDEDEEEDEDHIPTTSKKTNKNSKKKYVPVVANKKKRTELDRLNEDIRDMFICQGVITATGRRMCTIMSSQTTNKDEELNNKKSTPSNTTAKEVETTTGKRRGPKTNAEKAKIASSTPLRRSLRSCKTNEDEEEETENDEVEQNEDLHSSTDSSETPQTRRKMPRLKPHTPIKLPEEEETTPIKDTSTTATPKIKLENENKRKTASKPCPKSKKPKNVVEVINTGEVKDNSAHNSESENENESVQSEEKESSQLQVKNNNVHWHNQSKYINWCIICAKKIPINASAFHYKMHHGENYISRLPPVLLQKFKQGKLSQPLFGVDKSPKQPSWFYRCPFCLQYFNTPMPLWLEHLQNHTAEFRYECSKCHRGSNRVATTRRHISSQCKGATMLNCAVKLSGTNVIKAHVCHLCNYIQLRRANLERHYIEQHQLNEKNVDVLGYTITLFDMENVDMVPENKASEREAEAWKSIQTEERVIDIIDDDEEESVKDKVVEEEEGNKEKEAQKVKEQEVVVTEKDKNTATKKTANETGKSDLKDTETEKKETKEIVNKAKTKQNLKQNIVSKPEELTQESQGPTLKTYTNKRKENSPFDSNKSKETEEELTAKDTQESNKMLSNTVIAASKYLLEDTPKVAVAEKTVIAASKFVIEETSLANEKKKTTEIDKDITIIDSVSSKTTKEEERLKWLNSLKEKKECQNSKIQKGKVTISPTTKGKSVESMNETKTLQTITTVEPKSLRNKSKAINYKPIPIIDVVIIEDDDAQQDIQDELLALAQQAAEEEEKSNTDTLTTPQEEETTLVVLEEEEEPPILDVEEELLLLAQKTAEKEQEESTKEKEQEESLKEKEQEKNVETSSTQISKVPPTLTLEETRTTISDLISSSIDRIYQRNKRKSTETPTAPAKKSCLEKTAPSPPPPPPTASNVFMSSRDENNSSPTVQILAQSIINIDEPSIQTEISSTVEKPVTISMAERLSQRFKGLQQQTTNEKPGHSKTLTEKLNQTSISNKEDAENPPTISMAERISQRLKGLQQHNSEKPKTLSITEQLSQRFKSLQDQQQTKSIETDAPPTSTAAADTSMNKPKENPFEKLFNDTVLELEKDKEKNPNQGGEELNITPPPPPPANKTSNDDVTVISDDEDWEDIEITESAPAPSTSTNNAGNMQKSKNKGLFQKFGIFKGNNTKTKKHVSPMVFMPKKKSNTKENKQQTSPNNTTNSTSTTTSSSPTPSNKSTISLNDKISDITPTTTATNSNTTTNLGFKPVSNIMDDLLPDSPCNDPIDLVPELTPFEPLQDLNDISSILDSNLSAVSINVDDNHASMEDALNFVSEQQEQDVGQNQLKTVINNITHVGYSVQSSGDYPFKFYCLLQNCTFLYSSDAIGLENHFLCEHSLIKWNGYCLMCQTHCLPNTGEIHSIAKEIRHMLEKHADKSQFDHLQNESTQHSTTSSQGSSEDRPKIKLRRLTGDCLSTANGEVTGVEAIVTTASPTPTNAATPTTMLGALLKAKPKPPTKDMPPQPQMPLTDPLLVDQKDDCSPTTTADAFKSISNDFLITSVSSAAMQPKDSPLQISNVISLNPQPSTEAIPQIPKISSVRTLATKAGNLWSQQIEEERQELIESAAESMEISQILANAGRPSTRREPMRDLDDSPGPVVVAETVPVAQATQGDFVITQTVSAQYDENDAAAVGFNISIASTLPSTSTPNTDVTTPITSRQYKCMSNGCKFVSRVRVAMSDHLRFHERRNLSLKCDFFACAFCSHQSTSVEEFMKHADQYHIINKGGVPFISSSATSETDTATSLTRKIHDILNSNKTTTITSYRNPNSLLITNQSNQPQQDTEEVYFKKLRDTVEEIVKDTGKTDDKLYRCVVKNCRAQLTETTFFTHIIHHISTIGGNPNNYTFRCPHCPATYHRAAGIKAHIKNHAVDRYFCYLCEQTSPNPGQLLKHFSDKHWHTLNMYTKVLLPAKTSTDGSDQILDSGYYIAYTNELSDEEVKKFGEKLILELQRKKSGSKTHFKSSEIDLLPLASIFHLEVNCGECEYKTKVRTNMHRHLLMHKQNPGLATNSGQSKVVDPVNPVPCLNSTERFFDKMTNLASSSLVPSSPQTGTNSFKMPYLYVPDDKRFACGCPGCIQILPTDTSFREHLSVSHTNTTAFRCTFCREDICKKGISIDKILTHFRFHGQTLFRCEECNYLHHMRYVVERHVNDKHSTLKVNIFTHDRTIQDNGEGTTSTMTFRGKKYREHSDTNPQQQQPSTSTTQTRSSNVDATIAKPSSASSSSANTTKGKGKWVCDLCNHTSWTVSQIQSHCQQQHGQKNQYQCAHCNFGSQQLSLILYHIDEKHPGKTREARNMYHKAVNSNDEAADTRPLWQRNDPTRVRHIRGILMEDEEESEEHKKKLGFTEDNDDEEEEEESGDVDIINTDYLLGYEFSCFHCDFKTQTFDNLKLQHYQRVHNKTQETAKPFWYRLSRRLCCPECRQFIGNCSELQKHFDTNHYPKRYYAADITTSENDDNSQRLLCGYCSFHCSTLEQLYRHYQKAKHVPSDVRIDNDEQIMDILKLNKPENAYVCTLCTDVFPNAMAIVEHACNTHAGEDSFSFRELSNSLIYRCVFCVFTSTNETDLLKHMIDHYLGFKKCYYCQKAQTTFTSYMQHWYAEHRSCIGRFRDIYTFEDITKFFMQMLLIFPSGLILNKRNLYKTKYGSPNCIYNLYEEIYKISQQPPIPRLSIARLVARKSIEAQQKHTTSPGVGEMERELLKPLPVQAKKISKRRCTVAVSREDIVKNNTNPMNLINNDNKPIEKPKKIAQRRQTMIGDYEMPSEQQKPEVGNNEFNVPLLQPKKITKRRRTVAVDHETPSHTHISSSSPYSLLIEREVSTNKKRKTSLNNTPSPSLFSQDSTFHYPSNLDMEPFSYYGIKSEYVDLTKIHTTVAIGGIQTPLSIDKFKLLVNIDCQLTLTKCDDIDDTMAHSVDYIDYKHVKKACPASFKKRYN